MIINEVKTVAKIDNESDLMDLIYDCAAKLTTIGYRIDNDIEFNFINSSNTLGQLGLPRYEGDKFHLSISYYRSNDSEAEIISTIMHEFAHYFVRKKEIARGDIRWDRARGIWTVRANYANKPHGSEWKQVAEHISNGLHLEIPISRTNHSGTLITNSKYVLKCKNCGKEFGYSKYTNAVRNYQDYWCGDCGKEKGKLELIIK